MSTIKDIAAYSEAMARAAGRAGRGACKARPNTGKHIRKYWRDVRAGKRVPPNHKKNKPECFCATPPYLIALAADKAAIRLSSTLDTLKDCTTAMQLEQQCRARPVVIRAMKKRHATLMS